MPGQNGGEGEAWGQGGGEGGQPVPVKVLRGPTEGIAEEGDGTAAPPARITGAQSPVRGTSRGQSACRTRAGSGRPAKKQKSPMAHRALSGGCPPPVRTWPMCPWRQERIIPFSQPANRGAASWLTAGPSSRRPPRGSVTWKQT